MKIDDDILITYLLGETTEGQRAQVEAWLKADTANERRLEQFRLIWQVSNSSDLNETFDAKASLERFKQKTLDRQKNTAKILPLKWSYTWLKIAAALFVIVGGGWWLWTQRPASQLQLTTSRLEVKVDTLSDGSVITLNQNTVFKYPEVFKSQQRTVELREGEAFFNVAHQVNKPFIINAGKISIQVLGTSFNVKNKNGKVEVIVETGMVAVIKAGKTVMLRPHEKLSIASANNRMVKSYNTNQLYQYYRTHEFVADDTPLLQMVNTLNEAYDSHIVIKNPKLYGLLLNTTFKNESLDDILDIISRTFNVKVVKVDSTIILK